MDQHYGMANLAFCYASPITQQMSGVSVSECVFMQKDDFRNIQFDCRLFTCTFQCVSLVKITSTLMLLCWIYQVFTIFYFFYISQGSVTT